MGLEVLDTMNRVFMSDYANYFIIDSLHTLPHLIEELPRKHPTVQVGKLDHQIKQLALTNTQINLHACRHTHTHAHSHAHTHTHTTHTHTRAHTHTHTHTHHAHMLKSIFVIVRMFVGEGVWYSGVCSLYPQLCTLSRTGQYQLAPTRPHAVSVCTHNTHTTHTHTLHIVILPY